MVVAVGRLRRGWVAMDEEVKRGGQWGCCCRAEPGCGAGRMAEIHMGYDGCG